MDDARLVGEIMVAPQAFVMQPRSRTIGGGRHGAAAAGAADDLHAEMIDRHGGELFTLQSARRHDV